MFLRTPQNVEVINRLRAHGVNLADESGGAGEQFPQTLEGLTFVLTGALAAADDAAGRIAELVVARHTGDTVSANPLGAALSLGTGHEGKKRSTKVYNVLADKCVGCGTCAEVCPTGTVKLVDGKPVWSGNHCTECLRCLHFCPQSASQHGKVTEGRRRYLNPVLGG